MTDFDFACRVMKLLQLKQVGRYYYDPNRPASIPQHKIELWPGYITSIQCYEGTLHVDHKKCFKVLIMEQPTFFGWGGDGRL